MPHACFYNVQNREDLNCPTEINIDLAAPFGLPLSMFYKKSFAYEAIKKRWPIILMNIIDNVRSEIKLLVKEFGEESYEDVRIILEEIEIIFYEIKNNKQLTPIQSSKADIQLWNDKLKSQFAIDGHTTYLNTTFLFCECYIYRRMNAILEKTTVLKNYDLFRNQKKTAFFASLPSIVQVAKYHYSITHSKLSLHDVKDNFIKLLKLSLWSNKCDLSLTLGGALDQISDPFDVLEKCDENILVNDSERVWKTVFDLKHCNNKIGIILDNSGYELFLDCCLADFIISYGLAEKVVFYPKAIPWYISDTTKFDVEWLIETLIKMCDKSLQKLGKRWQTYLNDSIWKIVVNEFWTGPYTYCEMPKYNPKLYNNLKLYKMLIFKGDLNYRKLIDDINWYPNVSFYEALQGFHPTNLCILRTIKCDCIAGISKEKYERLDRANPRWNLSGDYALLQYDGSF